MHAIKEEALSSSGRLPANDVRPWMNKWMNENTLLYSTLQLFTLNDKIK